METRVLSLPIVSGKPTVPGHTVFKQGDSSGWYTAHDAVVPSPQGAPNDWSRPTVYSLYQCGSCFCVFGDKADLDKLGAGPALADYTGAWSCRLATGTETDPLSGKQVSFQRILELKTAPPPVVSATLPWSYDGKSITDLKKAVSSACFPVVDIAPTAGLTISP